VQHVCNHTCHVSAEFGNVFLCTTSGLLHVCDSTCTRRVWRDHHSSICVISGKICEPLPHHHMPPHRCVRGRLGGDAIAGTASHTTPLCCSLLLVCCAVQGQEGLPGG
jgi:hypothetical protein